MKAVWDFLNSLKLTVYLILAITGLTMFGSLVLYFRPAVFGDMDMHLLFPWLLTTGIENLELTWWLYVLVAMVVLLGVNTLVCTLERLPVVYRRYKNPLLNLRDIELGGESGRLVELGADAKRALAERLERRRYRVFAEDGMVYAEKNRWLPFVPYVVHIALMVFMVGHLVSGLYGYRHSGLFILEGDTENSPAGGYSLRLDKVNVEFRPDGSLKDFGSDLTAFKDGVEIKRGRVSANTPMFVEGGAVYQRQFGRTATALYIHADVRSTGFKGPVYVSRGNVDPPIPGTDYKIQVEDFLPDFDVDPSGRPFSRSENPSNPAAVVTLLKGGERVSRGWVFMRNPRMDNFNNPDVTLRFADVEVKPYSTFDVNRDPSALSALIASLTVMFGTILTLYVRRERVWANVDEKAGAAQVMCTDDELYDKL